MKHYLWLLLLLPLLAHGETDVFTGLPYSNVVSNIDGTKREDLTPYPSIQYEDRVRIVKNNGKYYWASRFNLELTYIVKPKTRISPETHMFINPKGEGYIEVIKITDKQIEGNKEEKKYIYKQHNTSMLANFTFWGYAEKFNP